MELGRKKLVGIGALMALKYLIIKKFCQETGYSESAVNAKIKRGDWEEDTVWRHSPDGRRQIIIEVYNQWVESQE